ncbi:class II glutamine amidotransferase [Pyxidicoccus fallax]|uniref:Class II glutamine amidotransferase n=1 Tax=Pyxidicoccus fallax TaxID=394095 RepID=A0A848LC95_9BACT|nr:class II glutamine amidotransferase [Pyxidicoccus fallax]NMO16297.1 class II glutamine amidotransferase [Pyxidicoccus fallax]NPC81858.1 class II glutamine amidotransferase [Pyxidicoccus fallax]
MSVVFAALTSDPNLLRCELHRLGGQVLLQGEQRSNAVGVGAYAQDEVLLRRFASNGELGMDSLAPPHESDALLFHGGRLPVGQSLEDNTQPFRARRWLFAHQGALNDFDALRAPLMASLPEHLQRQVRGGTDSEVLFALFLRHLRDVGRTDDPRLEADVTARLLADTAREVIKVAIDHGVTRASTLNLVATNGYVLAACRFGQEPLFYSRLEGSAECDLCGVTPGTPETQPTVGAHRRRRTVVVASHLKRPAGWVELPQGTALAVGPDLQVHHLNGA